jgi:type IV pilus assembly protein PilC
VKSALTYPLFVLGLAFVAVAVMAAWVLPKFTDLYASLGAELPLPTRMLLGFTRVMTHYAVPIAIGVVVLATAGYVAFGGARGKRRRNTVALRMPVLGDLFRLVAVERFCRVFATLVTAGVPLPEAITVSADSTNNAVFQARLAVVRDAMVRGNGLARPIAESGMFPPGALQMIRVGESTGSLDTQLHSAAEFYERELAYRLKKSTDLFEPIVIVVIGCVVGFVAVAQVSAMYSVFNQIET